MAAGGAPGRGSAGERGVRKDPLLGDQDDAVVAASRTRGEERLQLMRRRQAVGVGALVVDAVAEILEGADRHAAQRIRARVEVAGHELVREDLLAPVTVTRAGAADVRQRDAARARARAEQRGVLTGR